MDQMPQPPEALQRCPQHDVKMTIVPAETGDPGASAADVLMECPVDRQRYHWSPGDWHISPSFG